MKIIGLDSSGLVASAAIVEDGVLLAEYTTNYKKTHSQTLLPMLAELKDMIELDLNSVDAIAIAAGPGSFTGLRIGAATAKGLGLALDKPLVEVPTLEGLAYNLWGTQHIICPLMDARRNQVYTGLYEFVREGQDFRLQVLKEQCAVDIHDILIQINEQNREVIFLGDGVPVYREVIETYTKVSFAFAPASHSRQRAAAIASLGFIYYKEGKIVTAAEHKPEYLRKSQAEREKENA